MDKDKLSTHINLCRKNLKSDRVKCCASCPFEDEILSVYPDLDIFFSIKREKLEDNKLGYLRK